MKLFKRILLILPVLFLVLTCSKDDDPEEFILSVTIIPEEGGSVSPDGGVYDDGATVTLTGTPSEGYVFKQWMGDLMSNENPVSVSMDSDMTVTLVFVKSDGDNDGVSDDVDQCLDTPEGEEVDEQGCPLTPPIYLDENGVTVKAYEWSQVGQTGLIDGVVYTIVDEVMLREMVKNGADVTRVCTSKVTDMSRLFFQKFSFNQDIGSWDVSRVTDMNQMFSGDIMSGIQNSFNQDISLWDVSNVTNMRSMFHLSDFNQPIGNWDVGNVINMEGMFSFASFNQDISSWDVSSVNNMSGMFLWTRFNQPLGEWDVSNVTDMSNMFVLSPFNQPIGNWDVSNVENMNAMFMGSWALGAPNPFNQDISGWDVGNVTNMREMFKESNINQNLGDWNVGSVVDCEEFSVNTPQWTLPKPNFTNCNPD